jgi:hypothetical protein
VRNIADSEMGGNRSISGGLERARRPITRSASRQPASLCGGRDESCVEVVDAGEKVGEADVVDPLSCFIETLKAVENCQKVSGISYSDDRAATDVGVSAWARAVANRTTEALAAELEAERAEHTRQRPGNPLPLV